MKLAVIGNSHVAARRDAMRMGLVDLSGIEVTFWALPSGQFQSVRHEDDALRSDYPETTLLTSDGRYADLPLDAFDVLLFEGLRARVADWARGFQVNGMRLSRWSRSFVDAGLIADLEVDNMFRIARLAAARGAARVLASPSPYTVFVEALGFGEVSADEVQAVGSRAASLLAAFNIEFIPQPSGTVTKAFFTADRYLDGALRLVDPTEVLQKGQGSHMNGQFGAELWKATLERLAAGAADDPCVRSLPCAEAAGGGRPLGRPV